MSDKSKRDLISEEEFNKAATINSPETDSPGDSEEDAGAEFLTGLNYMPNEKNEYENNEQPPIKVFNRSHSGEIPADRNVSVSKDVRVTNSDQPAPWADLDTPSDTH